MVPASLVLAVLEVAQALVLVVLVSVEPVLVWGVLYSFLSPQSWLHINPYKYTEKYESEHK